MSRMYRRRNDNMKFVIGDLTEATEKVIAHGCNCQGAMGAGVAKAIKKQFPKAYKKYKKACNNSSDLLGTIQTVQVGNKTIANIFTQEYYGKLHKKFDYDNFEKAMRELMSKFIGHSIAIPRIGTGLGKGNWDKIRLILEHIEKKFNNEWVIYQL